MGVRSAWQKAANWFWDPGMKYPRPFLGWRQMLDAYREMKQKNEAARKEPARKFE